MSGCWYRRERAAGQEGAGKLHVRVIRGANLISRDRNGLSDPFVKVTLGSGAHKQEKQSEVVPKTLSPTFNADNILSFEVPHSSDVSVDTGSVLFVEVWDWDLIPPNQIMGQVRYQHSYNNHRMFCMGSV